MIDFFINIAVAFTASTQISPEGNILTFSGLLYILKINLAQDQFFTFFL
jgi:hypothetical protein